MSEKVNIEDNSLNSLNIISNDSNQLVTSYEKSKLNIKEFDKFYQ